MASTNAHPSESQSIADRITAMQVRQQKAKARLSVVQTEADSLKAELTALQTEHLELLRKFDSAARLP